MTWQTLFLWATCALSACAQPAANEPAKPSAPLAASYQAKVKAVSDGDTIRVIDQAGRQHKLRLAYIDAPEMQQAGGQASRNALRGMLEGQAVKVQVFELDRYRREVAQIWLGGTDINRWQLAQGHAWHYVSIAKRRQSKAGFADYSAAEAQAKAQRSGLWRAASPQAPWDFRRAQQAAQASKTPPAY